jgi:hypothetical protein
MTNPRHYHDKAQQCRELLKHVSRPEIAHQLRLWADEFDHLARVQVFGREMERNGTPRTVDVAGRRWQRTR